MSTIDRVIQARVKAAVAAAHQREGVKSEEHRLEMIAAFEAMENGEPHDAALAASYERIDAAIARAATCASSSDALGMNATRRWGLTWSGRRSTRTHRRERPLPLSA